MGRRCKNPAMYTSRLPQEDLFSNEGSRFRKESVIVDTSELERNRDTTVTVTGVK